MRLIPASGKCTAFNRTSAIVFQINTIPILRRDRHISKSSRRISYNLYPSPQRNIVDQYIFGTRCDIKRIGTIFITVLLDDTVLQRDPVRSQSKDAPINTDSASDRFNRYGMSAQIDRYIRDCDIAVRRTAWMISRFSENNIRFQYDRTALFHRTKCVFE